MPRADSLFARERLAHGGRGFAALTGVRFVHDEHEHLGREQRTLLVPLRVPAGLPAAARQQDSLNVCLTGSFCGLAHDAAPRTNRARSRRSIS